MTKTIEFVFIFLFVSLILGGLFFLSLPAGIFVLLGVVIIAFAARHRKNKSKARWQKHTKRRSGEIYDASQNTKKGQKNRKFRKKDNPNKKK